MVILLVCRSGNGLYPCHSGLSVSHDSVFTAEHRSPHSSSEDLDTAQSSSSLSIQQLVLPGVRVSSIESLNSCHEARSRGLLIVLQDNFLTVWR